MPEITPKTSAWPWTSWPFLEPSLGDVVIHFFEQGVEFTGVEILLNLAIPCVIFPAAGKTGDFAALLFGELFDGGLDFINSAHAFILLSCESQ